MANKKVPRKISPPVIPVGRRLPIMRRSKETSKVDLYIDPDIHVPEHIDSNLARPDESVTDIVPRFTLRERFDDFFDVSPPLRIYSRFVGTTFYLEHLRVVDNGGRSFKVSMSFDNTDFDDDRYDLIFAVMRDASFTKELLDKISQYTGLRLSGNDFVWLDPHLSMYNNNPMASFDIVPLELIYEPIRRALVKL